MIPAGLERRTEGLAIGLLLVMHNMWTTIAAEGDPRPGGGTRSPYMLMLRWGRLFGRGRRGARWCGKGLC